MGTLGRRVVVGLIMAIAGAVVAAVAIWILADPPRHPLLNSLNASDRTGESPKVGIAAGIFALVVGLACCFVRVLEEKKYIILAAILVVLVITLTSFGIAVKDRLDIKKLEDAMAVGFNMETSFGNQYSRDRGSYNMQQRNNAFGQNYLQEMLKKMKLQLTIMAVAAGIGTIFEIISMIIAFRLRPASSTRNAMQMERTF